ncbi:MAG TPA: HupE / UreJ protein [Gammaproteobacteria bacterium]|nr:HupE / UreJ protein [Gammaproteobacteria bacterium]|tara:strand:+ start:674 stop:1258 length:585 start_codon:yes stop_codon:yes gene_type:complete
MHSISLYVQLGIDHITDIAGFDHILFLIALCAVYKLEQWRSLLVLVTAFTVGHSVTLALSSFSVIVVASNVIEFLIPVTILVTAINNVFVHRDSSAALVIGRDYVMALFFGFIHGMGFSNYFRALLMDDSSIFAPLLGFNLGIEIAQLSFVLVIVGFVYLLTNVVGIRHRDWSLFVSGAAAGISVLLMVENRFW